MVFCGFFLGVIGVIVALVMPDKVNCHKDFKCEPEAINEYNDLYEKGIITKEEFEAKKKQILNL